MKIYNSLAEDFADIAKQWHPTKNGDLTPDMVSPKSKCKAWWLGSCGHEWEASVSSRTRGVGCPYCSNYRALAGYNDLATTEPQLAQEWNYEKNGSLKPTDVTSGSHKIVWWKCLKGHEWEESVKDRSSRNVCPYCANKRALPGYNDLLTVNPELAKEWNYDRNGDLRPDQILPGTEKKVWWKCSKGHEWLASVYNRNKGVGCPYCSNFAVLVGFNDLATTNPELAAEWNYEKNKGLKPTDVTTGSHKRVWWKCSKKHEWVADIKSRTSGNNCPYCSNKKVLSGYNDLLTVYPDIATEWSEKNSVSPNEVIRGGEKKYYWKCPLGHEDYLSSVDQRIRGQGCPICAQRSQTSFPEQAIFFYVKKLFPDAINRYTIGRSEIDIYIPSKLIGIEYNGYYSHKGKAEKDRKKRSTIESHGIKLILIKEYKYDYECQDADFYIHERTTNERITELINKVLSALLPQQTISVDCTRDQFLINAQYIDSIKENSIAAAMPEIVSEWDGEKNGTIKPEYVSRNSSQKFYWICPNCGYSYLAAPTSRYHGTSCPACAGKAVHPGLNDLKTKHPEILAEWDYEKNNGLDPATIFYRSTEVVWWKCPKGHSWQKSVYSRTKNKSCCPYCTGRRVIAGYNDLKTKRPDLAEEWDYSLNETTPDKIHYNNQTIQAHWICKQCGFKWVHTVSKRDRCPECLRRATQINVYNIEDLSLYGQFENARNLCEHLGHDYRKKQQSISNACRRVRKTFLGKYYLRYPIDDEFANRE